MISGPYYRLHCDGEGCARLEDFELEEVRSEVGPHFDGDLIERAVRMARESGWSFPAAGQISYSRGRIAPDEFRTGADRGAALCPKCTQKEADR